jgi:hypothetical protein
MAMADSIQPCEECKPNPIGKANNPVKQSRPHEAGKEATATQVKRCRNASKEEIAAARRRYRQANREKIAAQSKRYYEANREACIARVRRYRDENPEKCAAKSRRYYSANKEKHAASGKRWRDANKERHAANNKRWRDANKEKVSSQNKKRYERNKEKRSAYAKRHYEANKEKIFARERERRKTDVMFVLAATLRCRVRNALRQQSCRKGDKTIDLVGCTVAEFMDWLESKFLPGMTWENRGRHGWHIDHIIPLAKFDLSDPVQQAAAFHYTNLQPLWAKDNLRKSDKVAGQQCFGFAHAAKISDAAAAKPKRRRKHGGQHGDH